MVIEHVKDMGAMAERFARQGRMLPDGVLYQCSWMDLAGSQCYQIMEAPTQDLLMSWVRCWDDIVDFEIVPVMTSQDYWAAKAQAK